MVCLRNMCMATLNKGDNDYNNNNNNNNHSDNTRTVRREAKLALLNQHKINFMLAL